MCVYAIKRVIQSECYIKIYLTVLLEYVDSCAKDSVLDVMIVFWLISKTALTYKLKNSVATAAPAAPQLGGSFVEVGV